MNEIVEKTLLYDFYGELLTENQKKIYELHQLEDLSLGEISEQMEISRQGVFDTLKRCEVQLNHFENKLQLVAKFISNGAKAADIHEIALQLLKGNDLTSDALKIQIESIEALSKSILEDL